MSMPMAVMSAREFAIVVLWPAKKPELLLSVETVLTAAFTSMVPLFAIQLSPAPPSMPRAARVDAASPLASALPPKLVLTLPLFCRSELARTTMSPSFRIASLPSPPCKPTERVVAVSVPLTPLPPAKLNDELSMCNTASELTVTRPLLRMTSSSPPPSMPTALVTAPESEPAPEEPKPTLEPPVETRLELALTLSSPSFVMLSRPFPPAMPADCVEAVSEPLVPPVPPKLNDELSMLRLALELTLMRPLLRMTSSSSPPSMPTAVVTAPELAPAPEVPNATLEPPEEVRLELALTLSSPSFMMPSRPFPPAMPVAWVEAVSEPSVPPVPPKVKDELERERLAVERTSIAPPFQTSSSPAPARIPAASVNAPDAAPAPDEPNTTVEPFEEESVELAATVSAASL